MVLVSRIVDQREELGRPRGSLPAWPILTGLLVLAVGVRLVALAADLPFMHHPDEPVNLRIIDGMVRRSDPNPQFFKYPSLFLYLHAALHLDGPLLGWIPGLAEQAPITQVLGVSYAPTAGSVLVHRWVTVILGTAVVLVGWLTARRVTSGLLPPTMTGLLLALSPTLITYSRLITPDVPAVLFVAVAVYAAVRVQQSGSWWAYAAVGFAVGLAASTKYNAVLAAVPVVVAGLLGRRTALGLPLAGATAVGGGPDDHAVRGTRPLGVPQGSAVRTQPLCVRALGHGGRHHRLLRLAPGHPGRAARAACDGWGCRRAATVATGASPRLLSAGIRGGGFHASRP